MNVKTFRFEEDELVQVYLNVEESNNSAILKDIEEIKKKNSNVAIFVNGTKDTVKTIREILNYEKNSSKKIDL